MSQRIEDITDEPEQVQFEREHKEDRDELIARLKASNDRDEIVELSGLIYGPGMVKVAGALYDLEVARRGGKAA